MQFELEGKPHRIIWVNLYYIIKMIFKCNLDYTYKKVSLFATEGKSRWRQIENNKIVLTW